jgi:DNA-binding response OmpR family regulator
MKILILEDESILAMSMREFLVDSGYEVDCYDNSDKAYDAVFENSYDLLLLDVQVLGKKSGFEMLEELRRDSVEIPAIFITSLTDIEDLSRGYKCGGCDYIRKPFDLMELKLRVEQAIKLYCFSTDKESIALPFGYRYDVGKMKLFLGDDEIILTKKETKILELLIKQRGYIVGCDMFLEEVWDEWVDPTNIRMQVGSLRKKLKKDFIQTVRGMGYRIEF